MFTNNCRICLEDKSDNVALLFTIDKNDVISPSEAGKLYIDCLQLDLTVNDNYPNSICNFCKLQLSVFNNLKVKAKLSYAKFTKNERKNKVEIEDVYDSENCENQATSVQLDDDNLDVWVVNYLDEDGVTEKNDIEMKIEVDDDEYGTIQIAEPPLDINDGLVHENIISGQTIVPVETSHQNYQCKQCNVMHISASHISEHDTLHAECRLECDQYDMNMHNEQPGDKCLTSDETPMTVHKKYKSETFDTNLRTKSSSVVHKPTHNVLRKYECYICMQRFQFEFDLTVHLARHSEKSINDLGQRCKPPKTYQLKMNNTKRKPSYHFNCGKCDAKFYRKSDLMSHLQLAHDINQADADMLKAWYYI